MSPWPYKVRGVKTSKAAVLTGSGGRVLSFAPSLLTQDRTEQGKVWDSVSLPLRRPETEGSELEALFMFSFLPRLFIPRLGKPA